MGDLKEGNKVNDDFTGEGVNDPKNSKAVADIKSQLASDVVIISYGCESGKHEKDMQKISDKFDATVKGFTGSVSAGPGAFYDKGEWKTVSPSKKKIVAPNEEKNK